MGAGAANVIEGLREVPRYKICDDVGQAPQPAAKRRNHTHQARNVSEFSKDADDCIRRFVGKPWHAGM